MSEPKTMAALPGVEQRERILKILPGGLSARSGLRPRVIAARLALSEAVVDEHLRLMETQRLVSRNGGWWRRRSAPARET
jgi:hypothetical protein